MTTNNYDPSANSGSFTSGSNAYTDNAVYCTVATRNYYHTWSSYGVTDPGGGATIDAVILRIQAYQATGGDDQIVPFYSVNGGSNWTQLGTITPQQTTESESDIDITATESGGWTWDKLSNTNFKTRLSTSRVGGSMATQYIDWMGLQVQYSITLNKTGTDALYATESSPILGKSLYPTDSIAASIESISTPSRAIIRTESFGLTEALLANKGLAFSDSIIGSAESVLRGKIGIIMPETATLADSILKNADLLLQDVGTLLDSVIVDTGAVPLEIFVYEVIGLTYKEL